MKNHYQTLGLGRAATDDEIKQAYRKLVQKFHPDKNDGDKFFEDRFKEVQEAYEVLSNPYEKGRYDTEFDHFFTEGAKENKYSQQKSEGNKNDSKTDLEFEKKQKAEREKRAKEQTERERVKNVKRNAELSFEDKSWILIGSGLSMGVIGVVMFFKYLFEGYNKKSQQVCVLAIIGFISILILTILLQLGKAKNGY